MDKPLLLAFFLVSVIVADTPLKCLTCHLRVKSDRCRRGFGVCTAGKDELCMHLTISKGPWLQITYMDCQKFCKAVKTRKNGWTYTYRCCAKNYCNGKLYDLSSPKVHF